MISAAAEACRIWVIDQRVDTGTRERLGDARQVADTLSESVGALIVGPACDGRALIDSGADCVVLVESDGAALARVVNAAQILQRIRPRVVLASGDPDGRAWAARLAVRASWRFVSPALQIEVDREQRLVVTRLDASGRRCRKENLGRDETAVLTLRTGVAEANSSTQPRVGHVEHIPGVQIGDDVVKVVREIPADPRSVDIRYANRIVAGGRGVGAAEGFQLLARVAGHLRAGIAASRVAVDLGWIDRERQVGQTGKSVAPDLYVACGISGASHHLAGITDAKHVIAINSDPEAPIFKVAHLGLVADLHDVLSQLDARLAARAGGSA